MDSYERALLPLRKSLYCSKEKLFHLSYIRGSQQEADMTLPANCNGLGRIHHFNRLTPSGWVDDPLPMDPACLKLHLHNVNTIRAQVFQIALCNMKCWYCFVPDELRQNNKVLSRWVTTDEMIELYMKENDRPSIIDLSGGNPELVPEWIVQTMKSLEQYNLCDKVYLWSDDSMTTNFFSICLSSEEKEYMKHYRNYGKVGCIKGISEEAFIFNTRLPGFLFEKQLEMLAYYVKLGIDIYGYITLTSPYEDAFSMEKHIIRLFDKVQRIHEMLPLRIVPLKINKYSSMLIRMNEEYSKALYTQTIACEIWKNELEKRFSKSQLNMSICEVPLD